MLTRRRASLVVAIAGCVLAVSSCSSGATTGSEPGPGSASAASSRSVPTPDEGPTPTTSVTRAPDPAAPATVEPVKRASGPPAPTIAATAETFSDPVSYPDGLSLKVTGIAQETVVGKGPGTQTGAPMTRLTLSLHNGTSHDIALTQVVVTAVYGKAPGQLAPPVYTGEVRDFSGVAKPNTDVTAIYAFSIPATELGNVLLTIDLDGVHALATFHGKATT